MATFDAKADTINNRLYLTTKGFLGDDEMDAHIARIVLELAKLRPGFALVSDISAMKATTPHGAEALQKVMQEYSRRGISRIVRIVGQEVLAKLQLERVTKNTGIPVHHVTTRRDAEALLRGSGK